MHKVCFHIPCALAFLSEACNRLIKFLSQRHGYGLAFPAILASVHDGDIHAFPYGIIFHNPEQILGTSDFVAIKLRDDISFPDSCCIRPSAFIDLSHICPLRHPINLCHFVCNCTGGNAQIPFVALRYFCPGLL